MVANISKVLSGDWGYVREDIKAVIDIAHAAGAKVKVIFENVICRTRTKIRLCEICGELKPIGVKDFDGLRLRRRDPADLILMRKQLSRACCR